MDECGENHYYMFLPSLSEHVLFVHELRTFYVHITADMKVANSYGSYIFYHQYFTVFDC